MPEKKKPAKTTKKTLTPPPLDIGLPKSGLISSKKAMDIVPKGKTLPSSSAKPIIVSNRTIVKDPMSPPELPETPEPEKTLTKPKGSGKIVITPLHTDLTANDEDTDKEVADTTAVVERVDDTPESEPKLEEIHTEPDDENTDTGTITDEAQAEAEESQDDALEKNEAAKKTEDFLGGSADDTAEDIKKSTEPKPEELERKRAEKRAEEVAELIESKQYFLPINSVKKRRSTRFAWLILLLLVAGIIVLGLLDAGILNFIKAPTDFIDS